MKHRRLLLAAALALALLPAVEARADEACVDGSPSMGFGPFHVDATPPLFYGAEGGGGSFNVRFTAVGCGSTQAVSAQYTDASGSALEGSDYNMAGGQTPQLCEFGCPSQATVPEPSIANDPATEAVAESFTVQLSNPVDGTIDPPDSVPFVIADNDGITRVAFDDLAYSRSESFDVLAVPVWRAGPADVQVTVPYVAGPGPGSPATSGDDYTVTSPNPLVFGSGDRVELITLSIVNDKADETDESVQLTLQPPSGATLSSPETKVATIVDNEEPFKPESRFHHPRHKLKYKWGDYRIREMHIFTKDAGGSEVVKAELALRRNRKNGNCSWWNGKRFTKGPCGDRVWLELPQYEKDFFYYRIRALRPTVGTKIKNYTGFCRATDGAGNVEDRFDAKRNANTFEVKPKGRR
jgi:hypothetical protein